MTHTEEQITIQLNHHYKLLGMNYWLLNDFKDDRVVGAAFSHQVEHHLKEITKLTDMLLATPGETK